MGVQGKSCASPHTTFPRKPSCPSYLPSPISQASGPAALNIAPDAALIPLNSICQHVVLDS